MYAGSPSRVELSIRNDGERTTPVLRLFDPVSGTRGADLLLSPLEPDVVNRAAYRLPTERRGIAEIGPLEVVVGDPFGLATSSTIAAPHTELTVFPRIDEIVPVPHTSGDDPHAGADHPSALGRTGEDFYALRPYVVGDDLRRVHWRSTARHDELMVKMFPDRFTATAAKAVIDIIEEDDLRSVRLFADARNKIGAERMTDRVIRRTRTVKTLLDTLARDAIESGAARAKLDQLVTFTRGFAKAS